MPFSTGDRLGPYEILRPIGAGGMGDVYKARDSRLDRMVAIKVSKEQFSERFEREARAVAALNHPNICTLYDVGPNYLVMELVEGTPLKGPVPLDRAVRYAGQILDALDAAHRKGITHRDLKPANILITKQGAKLLDFGLAKQTAGLSEADATLTSALTGQGQILGTLHYMAPEQLQGKDADARSDIFAFGLVLYEMATGKRAFDSDSAASLIGAILHTEPAPISAAQPAAPPALERVVRKCLAKDPDDRFQTAREVKLALEWSASVPAAPAAAQGGKPRPWPWIVAGLAMAFALVVGVVHFLKAPPPAPLTAFTVFPEQKTAVGGFVAVSPDGRHIVFVARDSAGITQLWLRSLDSTETRSLPGIEGATSLCWSTDGRSVAFLTSHKLKRIEVATGQVFSVADISGAPRGLYWAPDGTIVFGTGGAPIRRVPATGGVPQALTTLDRSRGEVEHSHPWLLPGGKRFLFLVRSAQPDTRGIWVTSLAQPSGRKRILDDYSAAAYGGGYLLFVRDGALMVQPFDPDRAEPGCTAKPVAPKIGYSPTSGFGAFGVSPSGVLVWSPVYAVTSKARLTWFDRSGARIEDVGPARNYVSMALSPDGKRIATSDLNVSAAWPILIVDPARGGATEIGRQDAFYQYPVWSPDASRIAYEDNRGGHMELSVQNLSGAGGERSILESGSGGIPNDWSRDGRLLLYTGAAGTGRSSLWTVAPDGAPKPERLLPGDFDSRHGQFSPDGRWVAYAAMESPVEQVYVQSFPLGRGKWQISSDGGSQPRWRRDGKELFYVDPLGKMMSVEIKPGAAFEPGPSKALFTFRGSNNPFSTFRYDVTADGRKFLILTPMEDIAFDPLHVVINWTAALKK